MVHVGLTMWLAACVCAAVAAEPGGDAGLYTEVQATRGEQLYDQFCIACHGAKLQGNPAAPLAGSVFLGRWADGQHTLDDLFYIIRTQMPYNAPGSLAKQQYVDVVAYLLKVNAFPAGEMELTPSSATLKKVTLQPR